MPCEGRVLCGSNAHDGVRHHEDGHLNAGPDGSIPVDEMTHDYFWYHINFEDPVRDAGELEEFARCGQCCGDAVHENEVLHLVPRTC